MGKSKEKWKPRRLLINPVGFLSARSKLKPELDLLVGFLLVETVDWPDILVYKSSQNHFSENGFFLISCQT